MKYLRKYKLTVGFPEKRYVTAIDAEIVPSDGKEFTDLQIEFDIKKSDDSSKSLNNATISVYNLSDSTKRLIEQPDSVAILDAGWEDDTYGMIFQGDIVAYEHSKKGSDWVTKLTCADGYFGIREGLTHTTFPKGTTVKQIIEGLAKGTTGSFVFYDGNPNSPVDQRGGEYLVLNGLGLNIGELKGDKLNTTLDNSYSVAGPTKKAMDNICSAYDLKWSIQDGKLYVSNLKGDNASKYTIPLISESTGMIDSPTLVRDSKAVRKNDGTPTNGYKVKMTLNHEIIPEIYVKLESEEVSGIAKVKKVTHKGSFEGGAWDTEVEIVIQKESL